MELREYLKHHMIVGTFLPDYFCIDAIVDDPEEFIRQISTSDCYVTEIIMWARVRIGEGSKIGYGGPPDPRAPSEYFFSETLLSKMFDETDEEDRYMRFILNSRSENPDYDLLPSFTVAARQKT